VNATIWEIRLWQVFETPSGQVACPAESREIGEHIITRNMWNGKFPGYKPAEQGNPATGFRYLGGMWAPKAPFLPGWARLAKWESKPTI
jgi:hypothetical protein